MVDGLSMIRSAIFDELFGCLDAFAREIKFSLLFSTLSQIGSCFSISSVISFECALSCSKTLSCRAAKFASSTFMFASAFNRKERESKFDDRCGECRAHLDEGGEVEGSARREFQLDLLRRGRGGLLNDAAHEQSTAVPLTTKRISPAQRSRVFTLSRTRHLRTRSGAATNTSVNSVEMTPQAKLHLSPLTGLSSHSPSARNIAPKNGPGVSLSAASRRGLKSCCGESSVPDKCTVVHR